MNTTYRRLSVLFGLLALIAFSGSIASSQRVAAQAATPAATPGPTVVHEQGRLILATTTSTQDSGLLDVLIPIFKADFAVEVDVIAVGTGQAIELGKRGDADVLLVHARAQEDAFVQSGDGTQRWDVMYNDFIIVGPASDPAGIKSAANGPDAFKLIVAKGAKFVSRGDNSGTQTKELAIWKAAGITPKGDWYISAGQGMGATLTMTGELQAYTLSDRATYAARKDKGLDLEVLVQGGKDLLNPYGVIPVNPAKHPNVNAALAQKFVDWIISLDTQKVIASYQIAGKQVFWPDSELYRKSVATPAATMSATAVATAAQ